MVPVIRSLDLVDRPPRSRKAQSTKSTRLTDVIIPFSRVQVRSPAHGIDVQDGHVRVSEILYWDYHMYL